MPSSVDLSELFQWTTESRRWQGLWSLWHHVVYWAVTDGSKNLLPLANREVRLKSKFSPPWKSQNLRVGKSSVTGHKQSPMDSSSRLNHAKVGKYFCAERRIDIDGTVSFTFSRDRIALQVPAGKAVGCCRDTPHPRHVRWGGLDGILAVMHNPPHERGSLHKLEIVSDIFIVIHILMYYSTVNFNQKIYVFNAVEWFKHI